MKIKMRVIAYTVELALMVAVSFLVLIPSPAWAVKTPGIGTDGSLASGPGTTCRLPDGSQGQIQADGKTCCPQGTTSTDSCLYSKYINPLIALLSVAVGIVVAGAIIYGGLEYIMAGGDPQKAAAGRKRITNALLALAVYAALYVFLRFLIPSTKVLQ